jgi:hypothetical protein
MKKLIITVAHGNESPTTALEYGFLLRPSYPNISNGSGKRSS